MFESSRQRLTPESLFSLVSDMQVLEFYVGPIPLNRLVTSPVRDDDTRASFKFFLSEGRLTAFDYGQHKSYSVLDLLKEYFNTNSINEVLIRVDRDIGCGFYSERSTLMNELMSKRSEYAKYKPPDKEFNISYKRRRLMEEDVLYWGSYGVSVNTLNHFDVHPVENLYFNGMMFKYVKGNPIYKYGIQGKYKFYRPYSKVKFLTNALIEDVQGYEYLPKTGDILFITSSFKDIMALYEIGYYAIAPGGEAVKLSKEFIKDLKTRFKRVIVFYDFDKAGITATKWLEQQYGLECIYTQDEDSKDPSDFNKDGKDLRKLIDSQLQNLNRNKL